MIALVGRDLFLVFRGVFRKAKAVGWRWLTSVWSQSAARTSKPRPTAMDDSKAHVGTEAMASREAPKEETVAIFSNFVSSFDWRVALKLTSALPKILLNFPSSPEGQPCTSAHDRPQSLRSCTRLLASSARRHGPRHLS
eukprot:GHVT01071354.1.p1 GENE.GHVT01071354.1~~GHVT01071354.1.p1  ORF type:complete len:139 (+),score=23.50 GHVT01071354.1:165-581(+)